MAFFPRTIYNTEASFHPLFRFLEDFDKHSRRSAPGCPARQSTPAAPQWQPRFDVRETSDAYHLHGELPGLEKDQISIEFPEPRDVVIRGKVERTYTTGTVPAESTSSEKTIEEGTKRRNSHNSQSSYQATVEDEAETEDGVVIETPDETIVDEQTEKTAPAPAAPVDKAKYWLSERSIGEFSRAFTFPTHIDHEGVTANLNNGILTVVIPKAKKPEIRRITVY